MKLGFIGAGKVGTAFGCYLKKRQCCISGYWSRSLLSARKAAQLTDSTVFSDCGLLISSSHLVFITTNDDQIEPVAGRIANSSIDLQGKHFAHMSGALSSHSLKPLQEKGAFVFSMHPMQSFANHEQSVSDLENTTFGIEGKHHLEPIIQLLKKTRNPYLLLTPEQKTDYHITSCVVSNFLTALLGFGFDIMKSIGIEEGTARSALAPMIRGTVENNLKMGPAKALTGPIARGDIQTVAKHLLSLKQKDEAALDTYRHLGRLTLSLAKKEPLKNPDKIQDLTEMLS